MKVNENLVKICPRCHGEYRGHPAISRVDNETAICPTCGTRESLEAMGISDEEIEKIISKIPEDFEE